MACAAALALFGAGCGSDAETSSTASIAPPTTATATTVMATDMSPTTVAATTATTGSETTVAGTGSTDGTVQAVVDLAIADLAARLGVGTSAVTVLTAAATTWPDKSIGCPKPGMQYLQVLVDGALVELQASGKTYSYHSGDDGKPVLCEQSFTGEGIPPETNG